MRNISARNKGLITGGLIVLLSGIAYYFNQNFDNGVSMVAYFMYAAGVVWTLIAYHLKEEGNKNFKDYFQQGFKCYIVVTLIMVTATWIFLKWNVKMQNEMIEFQRKQLIEAHNYSEPDIEQQLARYKKLLLPGYTIGAILSYLGIGTLITILVSAFLSQFKRVQKV